MPASAKKRHFGVLSIPGTGHMNPLIGLSQELVSRGHRVTFFDKPKIGSRVREAGLEFVPVGANARIAGTVPPANPDGFWTEIAQLRFNLARIRHELRSYLAEAPSAIRRAGVDTLLIDETVLTGPTAAQILRVPYFILSTSVPHHFGWRGSSWMSGYCYSASTVTWLQSALLELSVLRMRGPVRRVIDTYRRKAGLGGVRSIQKEYPCLAHLTQLPRCMDLPRRSVTANFHYTGPFEWRGQRPYVAFPWDRLDGRPLVYASLGTTRNVQPGIFRMIAEACCGLDVQLVISLGRRAASGEFADLPGEPVVVNYAPQLELLKRARIVITHGGSNTALESLLEGKPMVAIPLAYDQPAIAARLARLGVGVELPVMRLSSGRIRNAITRVLNEPRFRDAAQEIQRKLGMIHGAEEAVDIIEGALRRFVVEEERARGKLLNINRIPAPGVGSASYLSR